MTMAAAPEEESLLYKVVLIGEVGVGKSSIYKRFKDGIFMERLQSTFGMDKFTKTLKIGDKKVALSIWDTAGMERAGQLTSNHYKKSHGLLFVYSVDDLNSLNRIEKWMENASRYVENPKIFIAGNKIDLSQYEHEVKKTTLMSFAQKKDLPENQLFTCSAKSGVGITEMFTSIAEVLYKSVAAVQPTPDAFHIPYKDETDDKKCCFIS